MYSKVWSWTQQTVHTHTHTRYSPIYIMKMASTYFDILFFLFSSVSLCRCVCVCGSFFCGSVFRLFITFTSFALSFASWPSYSTNGSFFGSGILFSLLSSYLIRFGWVCAKTHRNVGFIFFGWLLLFFMSLVLFSNFSSILYRLFLTILIHTHIKFDFSTFHTVFCFSFIDLIFFLRCG